MRAQYVVSMIDGSLIRYRKPGTGKRGDKIMGSKQQERERFIAAMAQEGMPIEAAQQMMRYAATLHRLAELESSSEEADRDRVKCPAASQSEIRCLCRDHGAYRIGLHGDKGSHGMIPRIAVQAWRTEQRASKLAEQFKMVALFQGDPRGAAIILKVPSGRTDDWGQQGLCVPQGRS